MSLERIPLENESTLESRRNLILEKYKSELEDPLLQKIISNIGAVWRETDPKDQEIIMSRLEEFLQTLREYYDSYNGLKAAARKERLLYLDDIDKFKQGVKNADAREKVLHDNFISSANILSRTMKNAGTDNAWRGDDTIYHHGGKNDSNDEVARDKFREWMFRIYHETFPS